MTELVKGELVTTEIDEWVAEVAGHLDGLPARERAEVLEDLRAHVAEVAAEGGTLDDAATYAAELVRAADLHPVEVRRPLWRRVARQWWIALAVIVGLVLLLGLTTVSHTQAVPDRPGSETSTGQGQP